MTVRWGYCPAEAWVMLLRCSAVLCYVSDSSLSLTLPTGHRYVTESCLYTIYGTRCVSYLWQSTQWGHWCKHCRHSAGLLQRYTSRNSWHCDNTAAVISENRRSFSIRNNFPGPLSLFYEAPLASGVAQHRFQEHNPVSTYMNSAYDRLKIFEVVLGCRHQLDNQCQKYRH